MGFISAIKDLFNKNIECGSDADNHIVFFAKKHKFLYVNKSIIVRDNTNCVVVYKNKVTDVIIPGKYKINADAFPETFSRAKSGSAKPRKIPCKLYFVRCVPTISNSAFSLDFHDEIFNDCYIGSCILV